MARMILVTGGTRSGKSSYAQGLGETLPGPRLYVATYPATPEFRDAEMEARIARHRRTRREAGWETLEEPLDLAGALDRTGAYGVRLVDCLTLWVSSLMTRAKNPVQDEDAMAAEASRLIQAVHTAQGAVICVTNEVGLGIVPENPLARLFRDLTGRCNQIVAAGADEVVQVVCGIPVRIKGA